MCLIVHILALWAWRQTFSISCTFSSIQLVSVCRQFRVFHQITDDHSNPMDGFGASHSLGLMTSSNSQQPLTSQSGNMLSVMTKGCWMDCKPVWLRPKRLINLLKVNGTNYTLSNEVKHFQGDHRDCYVEKLRAYVYLLPPGLFDAVMTILLCHQQRLKLYGTRSEDLQILGASWYFVPGWVQTSNTGTGGHRSLLRSLKHTFSPSHLQPEQWSWVMLCPGQTVESEAGDLLTYRCTLSSSQIPFCRWTQRKPCTERGKQRSAVHPDHKDQLWTKQKNLLTFSRRGNLSRELTPVK